MKRPQFTLRDLIWLVIVAAILAAWYVDRSRLAIELSNLQKIVWPAIGIEH